MRKHFAWNPRLFLGTHDFLFGTHDFFLRTHDFFLRTHDFFLGTHDFLPTTHDFLPTTHDFLPTTHDFLPTTHDFLPTTHDILPTTHDILPTTHDPRLLASPGSGCLIVGSLISFLFYNKIIRSCDYASNNRMCMCDVCRINVLSQSTRVVKVTYFWN